MNPKEEFIVHHVAATFLTYDYEGCLRIANNDLSFIANSAMFEGNLLRFFALASFKAFEHAIAGDDSQFESNFGLLI